MIISSSISVASKNVRVNQGSKLASTQNVSIGVVPIYSLNSASKAENILNWGIEISNDIAVVPSGESIAVRLVTEYSVFSASKKTKTNYTDSSDYDLTSLLGGVNTSFPIIKKDDGALYPKEDQVTIISQTVSLLSPASNPYTSAGQTWNFTI